jgi:hypothetical protein
MFEIFFPQKIVKNHKINYSALWNVYFSIYFMSVHNTANCHIFSITSSKIKLVLTKWSMLITHRPGRL